MDVLNELIEAVPGPFKAVAAGLIAAAIIGLLGVWVLGGAYLAHRAGG